MIKRINLIEAQPFAFTYLTLAKICLGVVLVLGLMGGYQFFKVYRLNKNIAAANVQLEELKKKRDELLKKPVKEKVNIGEFQALLDKMEAAPAWSGILNDISSRLPNAVWITAFKSLDVQPPSSSGKKKGKAAKEDKENKDKEPEKPIEIAHKLEFSGQSSDVRNLSEFLTNLSQSAYVKNLTLSESKKDKAGYRFVIKSEARTDAK